MEPEEIRRPIPGFQGIYSISTIGRIKSHYRSSVNKDGRIWLKEKILKTSIKVGGYRSIGLRKDKTKQSYIVSRLVALAFISNPENKPEVNHKNGNKLDNRVENLEWSTPVENTRHAHRLGLVPKRIGDENEKSKPVSQRRPDGKLVNIYSSINLAKQDGYSPSCIIRACQGKMPQYRGFKWKYI